MKIALRQEDAVSILEISGAVDAHNFQVLKAGLTKILQAGKNRIALNFTDTQELEGDVIHEIAVLDVFARELGGKIIIVAGNPELKESIRVLSKPPVIPLVSSVEQAVEFFKKSEPVEEVEADPAALRAEIETKAKTIEALEARLKLLDPTELNALRATNSELKLKLSLVEAQLDELLREKRTPVDAEGFLEKIAALEDSVKRLSPQEKQ